MGYVGKLKGSNDNIYPIGSTLYGKCFTEPSVAAKIVEMQSNDWIFPQDEKIFNQLMHGVTIHVYMENYNAISDATLNVDGTGAKPIYMQGSIKTTAKTTLSWPAGSLIDFTYDAYANDNNGAWRVHGTNTLLGEASIYDVNKYTQDRQSIYAPTEAGTVDYYLKSTGSTPTWVPLEIPEVSSSSISTALGYTPANVDDLPEVSFNSISTALGYTPANVNDPVVVVTASQPANNSAAVLWIQP